MKCLYCKAQMRRGTAPFSIERDGYHVSWDAIPAWVCDQCGESLFEAPEVDTIQAALSALDRGTVAFLDLKSNGFNLETSRLRDKFALSQLCGVLALTVLFLVLQGTQVVASGQRRQVDAHWNRGMSYLKLGWNWIRLAITQQWEISVDRFLSGLPDPHPAFASKRQRDDALKREFTVLTCIPAS